MLCISPHLIQNITYTQQSPDSGAGAHGGDREQQELDRMLASSPTDEMLLEHSESPTTVTITEPEVEETSETKGPKTVRFAKQPTVRTERIVPELFERQAAMASSLSTYVKNNPMLAAADFGERDLKYAGRSPAGPPVTIQVFTQPRAPPLLVKASGICTVESFIELALEQYEMEGREPEIPDEPSEYELRHLDDDYGSPDMDCPPLDRNRDIRNFGLREVALVMLDAKQSHQDETMKLFNSRRIVKGQSTSQECFLKIQMDETTTVIKVAPGMRLVELLPLIAKKKRTSILAPEKWNFFPYAGPSSNSNASPMSDALDMKANVSTLKTNYLLLRRKVPKSTMIQQQIQTVNTRPDSLRPSNFVFTPESAAQLSWYKVIKTNSRGREQVREMGIDRRYIYNRTVQESSSRFPKFLTASKSSRAISTVLSATDIPNAPGHFRIVFKEKNGLTTVTRDYKAETQTECAEIVAKLNYLMKHRLHV